MKVNNYYIVDETFAGLKSNISMGGIYHRGTRLNTLKLLRILEGDGYGIRHENLGGMSDLAVALPGKNLEEIFDMMVHRLNLTEQAEGGTEWVGVRLRSQGLPCRPLILFF